MTSQPTATVKASPLNADFAHKSSSLITSIISNWIPFLSNMLIAFFLTPYIIHTLGKEQFGIWTISLAVIGYYGLLQFGVAEAVMRYLPYHRGKGEHDETVKVFSNALSIYLVVAFLFISISFAAAETFSRFFEGGEKFITLIRILGLAAAIECPARVLDTCLRAYEKWSIANGVVLMESLLRAGGLAICMAFSLGLEAMGWVQVGATLFYLLGSLGLFLIFCRIPYRISAISYPTMKKLFAFGMFSSVSAIVVSLRLPSHSLIVGKVVSLEAAGLYAVAITLMRNVRQMLVMPTRVFWPRFAFLDGKQDIVEVRAFMLRASRFCAILTSLLILGIVVLGPKFVSLWVGDGFSGVYSVILILAIGYLWEGSFGSIIPFLGGTGHQQAMATISACEGVGGLLLSTFLAFFYGLNGVAFGFLIVGFISNNVVRAVYVAVLLKMSIINFYRHCFLGPWILTTVLVGLFYFMGLPAYVNGWSSFAVAGTGIVLVFCFLSYVFLLNSTERQYILTNMKSFQRILG